MLNKNLLRRSLPLLLVIALAGGAFACSGGGTPTPTATTPITTLPPTTTTTTTSVAPTTTTTTTSATATLDEAAVRAFADPIVTPMMQGLSDGNYTEYVANADAQFKAALTEAAFQQAADTIKTQIGTFQSAVYQSWQMQQGYIVVHYKATYSGGTVGVRLVFDSDHLVAGQFFE